MKTMVSAYYRMSFLGISLLVCVILSLLMTSCEYSGAPQAVESSTLQATIEPTASLVPLAVAATDARRISTATASIFKTFSPASPAPSPTPLKDFPMPAADFFNSYQFEVGLWGGWLPSEVLGYTDAADNYAAISSQAIKKTKWYIVSSKDITIEVNEVKWVSDMSQPDGFNIIDSSPATKKYQIREDTQIWLIIESGAFLRIPVSDLGSYVNSTFGKTTLWNFTVVKNKVTILVQQYEP